MSQRQKRRHGLQFYLVPPGGPLDPMRSPHRHGPSSLAPGESTHAVSSYYLYRKHRERWGNICPPSSRRCGSILTAMTQLRYKIRPNFKWTNKHRSEKNGLRPVQTIQDVHIHPLRQDLRGPLIKAKMKGFPTIPLPFRMEFPTDQCKPFESARMGSLFTTYLKTPHYLRLP